jgi:dihydropyrimidinase
MGTLIKNGTVVSSKGSWKLDVLISGEVIVEVASHIDTEGHDVVDATGLLVMPGGIDVHTHLDMPFGGTTSADDYTTGTLAAAIGGTTTVIDFALQNQSSTLKNALDTWLKKSDGKACVDFSLHMAVTNLHGHEGAETLAEMEEMVAAGISSFKLFMAYPNVLMVNDELMFRVMQKAADLNALCLIHAENGSAIDVVVAQMIAEGKTEPHYHALSRSPKAEAEATHRAIALADIAGAAVYIVHLSNEDALAALKFMQARGAKALAETCIQYLVLSIEDQMPGKSWEEAKYVFTPPLREKWNQEPLWDALADGALSVVSTDHCPFRFADQKELGRGDFRKIPNGGPGVENRLQILWHFGVNAGKITPERFVELAATAPARIFGMEKQKGSIAAGLDADVLLWDPSAEYTISAKTQKMATDYSMFEGWKVKGNAAKVYSRGELVVDNVTKPGEFLGATGRGRFVRREANAGGLNPGGLG